MYYIFNINIVKHHRYWKVQSTSFQSVQTEACLLKTTAVLSAAKPYHSVRLLIKLQYTRCSDFEAVGFRMLNVLCARVLTVICVFVKKFIRNFTNFIGRRYTNSVKFIPAY